jgi:thioredoxin-related protein
MKKLFLLAGWVVTMCMACAEQPPASPQTEPTPWMTDYPAALQKAKAENKYLLLNFTGTDWCPWCVKLDKEVFSKLEFKEFANEKLVLMLVDFPMRKVQPEDLKTQNANLQGQFGVQGYPTILILNPEGKLAETTGYQQGGAAAYVAHLKGILAKDKKP